MSRIIQKKILPDDWFIKVINYDTSKLSKNSKIIADKLIENIKLEKDKALQNNLNQSFIKHVIFQTSFLSSYDELPEKLISEGINEIDGNKGYVFSRKLHSLFIEFLIYKELYKLGFRINTFKRINGSCDLEMIKGCKNFNFEVKFKENDNIQISRLYDYLDGFSLLPINSFLRENHFEVNLLDETITDSNIKGILAEIDIFIQNKNDIYRGSFVEVFPAGKYHLITNDISKKSLYLKKAIIKELNFDELYSLINNLFIGNKKHLTKLIEKSLRPENKNNFNGCLVWTIPFHSTVSEETVKKVFRKIYKENNLSFNLHIFTSGIAKKELYFVIKKSFFKKFIELIYKKLTFFKKSGDRNI